MQKSVSPRFESLAVKLLLHPPSPLAGRDGTKYSRFHPTNYLSHHLAGIVTAAVFADAAHIVEEIVLLKTRVTAAAAADPTE
jgi:hypothetical protein